MRIYPNEQKVFRAGNVEIGGQPGERPTVLVGSLFYKGHKAVSDPKVGEFDPAIVEADMQLVLEWSDKTGLPVIFDVVGSYAPALQRFIEFVAGHCDVPFLVDGTSDDARVPAMQACQEWGLLDRAILNSIDYCTTDDFLAQYSEIGVQSSVLLAFESKHLLPEKKVKLLTGESGQYKGLLQKAQEAGIGNILVDVAVLDVPSIAFCARTQELVKEQFGLPVGCAPPNAIFEWEKAVTEFGREGRVLTDAAACVFLRDHGADFLLFGPCNKAASIFPAVAFQDAVVAYYQRRVNKMASKPGPLNKIF
ncbi:MAG TPA: tetrahydromethanopterin S-methyltransferase subunit H [Candidatus Lokiarchaeia archaeon]|nr:tetrahydromethanopterin S-methyltransferase subunit H [Candidatus Lokiarchaeia archaeon]